MKCPRCQGFFREETIYGDTEKFDCLACMNCGECLDPQIIENRMESLQRIRSMRPKIKPEEAESTC